MLKVWSALSLLPILAAQPAVNSRKFQLSELQVPPGFEVSVFAALNASPRMLTVGPDGVLYAAAGSVVIAIPAQGKPQILLSGLNGAHSVAFRDGEMYIAQNDGIYRVRDAAVSKIADLPAGGQHNTRTIAFGPDGKLYATAGSTCNFCVETDSRRASMMRFDAAGSNRTVFATGLRNSVDFAWHPVTGELWATDNGGDGLGDNIPPDEVNILREGGDYGWPDCYGQKIPVDWGPGARTARCPSTIGPEVEILAHSAPLGIAFYGGANFPSQYAADAFVALHGSWNRNDPSGYKVVRVVASSGHAQAVEDFLWGFFDAKTRTRSGRPTGIASGSDGALYVSDDTNGNIYRIVWTGPRINPGGIVPRGDRIYELYGSALAIEGSDFSISANGVSLTPLYAGPGQVNFQLPDDLTGDVTIVVTRGGVSDQATFSPGT